MTKKQLDELVQEWQQRLGLERWKIEVKVSDRPLDSFASVTPSAAYDDATMEFSPGLSNLIAEQSIVHELIHLLLRDIDAVVEDSRSQLHPHASVQVEKRYEHALEGFVERLSQRLVEFKYEPTD